MWVHICMHVYVMFGHQFLCFTSHVKFYLVIICLNNFKCLLLSNSIWEPSVLSLDAPLIEFSHQSLEYYVEVCERFIGKEKITRNPCSKFSLCKVMMLFKSTESLHTHHFDTCHIPRGYSLLKGTARSNVSADVGTLATDRTIPVQSPWVVNEIILRTFRKHQTLAAWSPALIKSSKCPSALKWVLDRMAGRWGQIKSYAFTSYTFY